MSRLTRRIIDICGSCDQQEYCRYTPNAGNCYLRQLHEKLKHYEDLEEQGLLLELPCKVGDTVWEIQGVRWKGYDWKSPVYDNASVTETKFNLEMLLRIGKKAFLTKEEAEAKLKELKGE